MHELAIGNTTISYSIRTSKTARRKRIIVTPKNVEVVAPISAKPSEIVAFAKKKRRWIFDKQQEMNDYLDRFEDDSYSKLQSGAKVPYWGRNVRIKVSSSPQSQPSITYRGIITINVPDRIEATDMEVYATTELTFWLKKKLKTEAKIVLEHYAKNLGANYKALRIGAPRKLWGSCTKSGVIQLNWHLIAAPKAVLEYVILHELCHLKYRNHSKEFWALLAIHMPDFTARKKWLESINPTFHL